MPSIHPCIVLVRKMLVVPAMSTLGTGGILSLGCRSLLLWGCEGSEGYLWCCRHGGWCCEGGVTSLLVRFELSLLVVCIATALDSVLVIERCLRSREGHPVGDGGPAGLAEWLCLGACQGCVGACAFREREWGPDWNPL